MSVLIAKPTLIATALVVSRAAPSLMSGVSLLKNTWWAACKIKDGIVYAKDSISRRYYSDTFEVIEEEEIVDNDSHCAMCKQLLTNAGNQQTSLIMFKGCEHRFHYHCLQNLRNVVTKYNKVKGKCPKCNQL